MLIEELIDKLDAIREKHGNVEVEAHQKYNEYTGDWISGVIVEDDPYGNGKIAVLEFE